MMKKRLLTFSTITALLFAALPAAAQETGRDFTIEGEGLIQLGDDANQLIQVTMSTEFDWYVTAATYPDINSPEFHIKNDSDKVTLAVTLQSFQQTNQVTIPPDTLTLNLTGDLREGAIGTNVVGYTGTTPYSQLLGIGEQWDYGFDGTYTGTIPANALQPTYDMVIKLSIDSYEGQGE